MSDLLGFTTKNQKQNAADNHLPKTFTCDGKRDGAAHVSPTAGDVSYRSPGTSLESAIKTKTNDLFRGQAELVRSGDQTVCAADGRLKLETCNSKLFHATTSVPQAIGWVKKPGRTWASVAGRIRTRATPFFSALVQASSLGSMPPLTVAAAIIGAIEPTSSQRSTAPSASFTPGTS